MILTPHKPRWPRLWFRCIYCSRRALRLGVAYRDVYQEFHT